MIICERYIKISSIYGAETWRITKQKKKQENLKQLKCMCFEDHKLD